MARQSSRLLYMDFDHKDIFFRGHKHKKMYQTDNEGNATLLWEKLSDESAEFSMYTAYYETVQVRFNIAPTKGVLFDGSNKDKADFYFECNSAYHNMTVSVSTYGGSDGIPKGGVYVLTIENKTSANRTCPISFHTKVPFYKFIVYGDGGDDHSRGGGHESTNYALNINSPIPTTYRFNGEKAFEFYKETPAVGFRGMIKNNVGANLLKNCSSLPHANFMFAHCTYVSSGTMERILSPLKNCKEFNFTFFDFGTSATFPSGFFNANIESCHGVFARSSVSIANEIFANNGKLKDLGSAFAYSTIRNNVSALFSSSYSGLTGEGYSRFDDVFYKDIMIDEEPLVDCISEYLTTYQDDLYIYGYGYQRVKDDVLSAMQDKEENGYKKYNVVGYNKPIKYLINQSKNIDFDMGVRITCSLEGKASAVLVGGLYHAFDRTTVDSTYLSANMLDGCSGALLENTFCNVDTIILPELWANSGLHGTGSVDLFFPLVAFRYVFEYERNGQRIIENKVGCLDASAGRCFGIASNASNESIARSNGWLGTDDVRSDYFFAYFYGRTI